MADAVHEVLIDLVPGGLVLDGRRARGGAAGVVVNGSLAVEHDIDELLGVVDARGDVRGVDQLVIEAREVDVFVRGDHDALAVGDLVSGEDVLGASGALGLGLELDAHLGGLLLEVLGGHVGVGDAGRAGGNGQDLGPLGVRGLRGGGRLCLLRLGLVALGLGGVDGGEELVGGLRGTQLGGEVFVHQERRELGEHLEVDVVLALGSSDGKDEVAGSAVGGVPVHAAGDGHGSEAGLCHRSDLGVRDGDAVAHGGGELRLAGKDAGLVAVGVGDVTSCDLQGHELVDGVGLTCGGRADLHALRVQKVSDLHTSSFPWNCLNTRFWDKIPRPFCPTPRGGPSIPRPPRAWRGGRKKRLRSLRRGPS